MRRDGNPTTFVAPLLRGATGRSATSSTTQSAVARLEDASYEGRSLTRLNRIAAALERRVEIRFVPRPKL